MCVPVCKCLRACVRVRHVCVCAPCVCVCMCVRVRMRVNFSALPGVEAVLLRPLNQHPSSHLQLLYSSIIGRDARARIFCGILSFVQRNPSLRNRESTRHFRPWPPAPRASGETQVRTPSPARAVEESAMKNAVPSRKISAEHQTTLNNANGCIACLFHRRYVVTGIKVLSYMNMRGSKTIDTHAADGMFKAQRKKYFAGGDNDQTL